MFDLEKEVIKELKLQGNTGSHILLSSYIVAASLFHLDFQFILALVTIPLSILIAFGENRMLTIIALLLYAVILLYLIFSMIIREYHKNFMKKGLSYEESYSNVVDIVRNLWLLNPKVLSLKDWHKIKKSSAERYKNLISENSNGHCYNSTSYILKTLKSNKIKSMWLIISDSDRTFGHAVLTKNNYIYDPSHRRTFNRQKFLTHYNGIIFKEFSYNEFYDGIWEDFEEFCNANGGIRDTNKI